jgi:predicted RNA-binding protein with PUA-like domain
VVVDLKPVKKLKHPVTLKQVKATQGLQEMDLVRLGRLSVQSVKDFEWEIIMEMAGER